MKELNGCTIEDIVNEIKNVVEVSDTEEWKDESANENGFTLSIPSGWKLMVYNRDSRIIIEVDWMDLIMNDRLPVNVMSEIYKINNIFNRDLI